MEKEIIRATETNYKELVEQATHPFATQEEINELGVWFEHYSNARYWNGQSHEVDKNYRLYPIYELVDPTDEDGEQKLIKWELK